MLEDRRIVKEGDNAVVGALALTTRFIWRHFDHTPLRHRRTIGEHCIHLGT